MLMYHRFRFDSILILRQIAVANKCLSNFRLKWAVLLPSLHYINIFFLI